MLTRRGDIPSIHPPTSDFGMRLGNAPQIDEDFVGWEKKLDQLRTWLTP